MKLQPASLIAGAAALLRLTGCDRIAFLHEKMAKAANGEARPAGQQPDQRGRIELVNARDPGGVIGKIGSWGYRAGAMRRSGSGLPLATIRIGNSNAVAVFGGCRKGAACSYMVLTTLFADVRNPPQEWLSRINQHYDLVSVSAGGRNGELLVRMPLFLGRDGIPEATMRAALQQYEITVREVAHLSLESGLVDLN